MDLNAVLKELEKCGTMQNRKVYRCHGVSGEQYGISFANLNVLKRKIRMDHELAIELWDTGNHDARVLATMIADAERMDDETLGVWLKDLDNYIVTDSFAGLVSRHPRAQELMESWIESDGEWTGRAGWQTLAILAMRDTDLQDDYFAGHLETIERDIHTRQNRVKDAMNSALIAIGIRNEKLEKKALAAAKKIGNVEVDHGETGCKTPDAEEYILKVKEQRQEKQAGK
jgi:3-methyladenine DNA glycosylase AlkD